MLKFNKIRNIKPKIIFFSLLALILISTNYEFSSVSIKNQKLDLTLSLLKTNIEQTEENFIVSPFSVYIIADMLANGAKKETLQKLQNKILDKNKKLSFEDINHALNSNIEKLSSATKINNSIWGNYFKNEYKEKIKTLSVDIFALPSNTDKINSWIESKTHGMIKNILPSENTLPFELYLVNTIYFKAKWLFPFNPQNTVKEKFYSLHKNNSPDFVQMMYQENESINYYENSKLQAIRLPYLEKDYIDIILPKRNQDFKKIIQSLTTDDLNFAYKKEEVHISLPRFETEFDIDLKDYFKKMQIPLFEDDKPDFSALCLKKCYVKKIIQKAKIQIDEEGTTAAAATAAMMDTFEMKMDIPKYKIFNANHPFIYIINDGLFIGVFMQGNFE